MASNRLVPSDSLTGKVLEDALRHARESEKKEPKLPVQEDPSAHTCPNCGSPEIGSARAGNRILGPGYQHWHEYFFCRVCGIPFGDAPGNRK